MSQFSRRGSGSAGSFLWGRLGASAVTVAVLVAGSIAGAAGPVSAGGAVSTAAPDVVASPAGGERGSAGKSFDARRDPAAARGLGGSSSAVPAAGSVAALAALRSRLGPRAVVDLDPLTGTPRQLGKLDGFLTGPSKASARAVVEGYLRRNAAALNLTPAVLRSLVLRREYTDIEGTRHLSWVQQAGAVPLFGNGLKAAVTKRGELVMLQGAPVPAVSQLRATPTLTSMQARSQAMIDAGGSPTPAKATTRGLETTFAGGDSATLVGFQTPRGTRLAWRTVTLPKNGEGFVHVIDAATGEVLYRHGLANHARPNGLVWDDYPGAPSGGKARAVDLTRNGWLAPDARSLKGPYAHAFTDLNGDDKVQPGEDVAPGRQGFRFPLKPFDNVVGVRCSTAYPCTWDHRTPFSWRQNREQNAVQAFYFVNKFRDHLLKAPIGFTRAAGNFDTRDGDALRVQTMYGANTSTETPGLPDSLFLDNATMETPPDGQPPTMRLGLFRDRGEGNQSLFLAGNSGDTADIVYHEYVHGLSNRLVVSPSGESALTTDQPAALGEGWSDWYALDLLVGEGSRPDTAAPGEVLMAPYLGQGKNAFRTQPIDCPVGTTSPRCPGTPGAGRGGYTFGDVGRVAQGEGGVYGNSEIWSQTLWDLRAAIGVRTTRSLVTRAMELSPVEPTFLDMRNAIVQADLVVNRGRNQAKIWKAFAQRGMGWFAALRNYRSAIESFSMPPAPGTPTGSLTGVVADERNAGIPGVLVEIGGHRSGLPGDYAALTDAKGRYTIAGILPGTYPMMTLRKLGFESAEAAVSVAARRNVRNWRMRHDWALFEGGSAVVATNGEATEFCDASALFDNDPLGWTATRTVVRGKVKPKFVTLRLPRAVDLRTIRIDPSSACGQDESSATGAFSLAVSTDGKTFKPAVNGRFTRANSNRAASFAVPVAVSKRVRFVRYTMRDSVVAGFSKCPNAELGGCTTMSTKSLSVYGLASK